MGIKKPAIICVGGANIDHKLIPSQTILLGTSNPVTSHTAFGGVARNVADNLAHWTTDIYLQTLVGEDAEGAAILNDMKCKGVNTDCSIILPSTHTSHYYAVLTENGELHSAFADMAIYNHCPDTTFVQNMQRWPKNALIFMDTNFPDWIFEAVTKSQQHNGWKICLDPVSIAKCAKIPSDLSAIYLIKPNREEAGVLTGINIQSHHDAFNAAKILQNRGVENVIISLGREGYVIAEPTSHYALPAFTPRHIIDVNGAGDAFFAGILYGLQQAYALREACEYGAAAACLTLETAQTVLSTHPVSQLQLLIHQETTKQVSHHANVL